MINLPRLFRKYFHVQMRSKRRNSPYLPYCYPVVNSGQIRRPLVEDLIFLNGCR